MRNKKCLMTYLFGLLALMFVNNVFAGYDFMNRGQLVISDDNVDFKIYKGSHCYWDDPKSKVGFFNCGGHEPVSREEIGELLMVSSDNRCLFLLNGVVSRCPKSRRSLVIIKDIPGYKVEGVNFLSIVNYDHDEKDSMKYASN